MRRIELTEGQPCNCVAKTDRERVVDDWRITCRLCGSSWWWAFVEVAAPAPVLRHRRPRVRAVQAS